MGTKGATTAALALAVLIAVTEIAFAQGRYGFRSSPIWSVNNGCGQGAILRGLEPGYVSLNMWGISRFHLGAVPHDLKIRTQIAENISQLDRHRLELQSRLYDNPIDRDKITQLRERMLSLQDEIARWQTEQAFRLYERQEY